MAFVFKALYYKTRDCAIDDDDIAQSKRFLNQEFDPIGPCI